MKKTATKTATKPKRPVGRPSKPAKLRATVTLTVRLYREDAATLDALMAARGASASDVLREALRVLHSSLPAAALRTK